MITQFLIDFVLKDTRLLYLGHKETHYFAFSKGYMRKMNQIKSASGDIKL